MLSNSLPSPIPPAFGHCAFAKVCYPLIFPNTWHPFLHFLPHWGRRVRWGVRFRRPCARPYTMNIKNSSWGRWQESQPLAQRGSDGQTWTLHCVLMWIWVYLGGGESCWDQRLKIQEALYTGLHVTEHLGESLLCANDFQEPTPHRWCKSLGYVTRKFCSVHPPPFTYSVSTLLWPAFCFVIVSLMSLSGGLLFCMCLCTILCFWREPGRKASHEMQSGMAAIEPW